MPFLMCGHFVHSITFFCYYEILMSLSCSNFWGDSKTNGTMDQVNMALLKLLTLKNIKHMFIKAWQTTPPFGNRNIRSVQKH